MTARFTLEMPEELLARVDEARGDVARNRWIRRAVEQALAGDPREFAGLPVRTDERIPPGTVGVVSPVRSSRQARDFKPYPKKGKR